jgi:hypothetical protein
LDAEAGGTTSISKKNKTMLCYKFMINNVYIKEFSDMAFLDLVLIMVQVSSERFYRT